MLITSCDNLSSSPTAALQPLGTTPQQASSQPAFNGFPPPPSAAAPPALGGDKYSNLSDLFSVETTKESAPTTGKTLWYITIP